MTDESKYIDLITLLKQLPTSENEALVQRDKAVLLAAELQLAVHLKSEGDELRDGLNVYPNSDKANIGALFYMHSRLSGWRWSTRSNYPIDWSMI
jgi:hypothetical protein